MVLQWAVGLIGSALIGGLGYRKGSLSGSGMLGAVLVGSAVFGFGGWIWGALLIVFFISSSLLSHYRKRDKECLAEKFAKGMRRDLGQTLANGGWGMVLAFVYFCYPHPWLFVAYVGSIATVNADTWATELGVMSKIPPRLITTGQEVPVGASGGVSPRGILAALAGAIVIGLSAFLLSVLNNGPVLLPMSAGLVPIAALAGLAGALFDSLLGATVQRVYWCDDCASETERRTHRCGQKTRPLRGWRWLDNDGVNGLSSVAGSLVALALARFLWQR